MRDRFIFRSMTSPALGSLTVTELCCLTSPNLSPVGIYVFSKENKILYVGKTHGRSLHERMISHIDHRKPIEGSPHLAQFVSSLVKKDACSSEEEAVCHVLAMKITWLPIPRLCESIDDHKKLIAVIERRLLWCGCLDPMYNSPRVKRNNSFTIKGARYHLRPDTLIGDSHLSVV